MDSWLRWLRSPFSRCSRRGGVTKTYTMGEVTVHAPGDAYRVDVSIVVWEADDVVQVPTSALFRHGPQWAVYAIRDGRARLTPVEIGRQTGRHAEMAGGL